MSNQQWVHLIIILIVASMSVIGWIVRRVREYQIQQQARMEQQRRREHALRTGRTELDDAESLAPQVIAMQRSGTAAPPRGSESIHDEARRRLQELAQKRRAELEAMARRAAGQAESPPTSPRPPTAAQRPAAPRPATRPVRPAAPGPGGAFPAPIGRAESDAAEARRRAEKKARAEAARRQALAEQAEERRAATEARAAQEARSRAESAGAAAPTVALEAEAGGPRRPPAGAGAGPALPALGRLSAGIGGAGAMDQWRRAIVMLEVLGPPPGLREPSAEAVLGAPRTF